MSEEAHLKDWYVAQVVVLTNENRRLINELHESRKRLSRSYYYPAVWFAIGYSLACILWRAFP